MDWNWKPMAKRAVVKTASITHRLSKALPPANQPRRQRCEWYIWAECPAVPLEPRSSRSAQSLQT